MTNASPSLFSRCSAWCTPVRISALVYLLTAFAIWWFYSGSPLLVINAGPQAAFAGFTPDGKKMLTNTNGVVWNLWDVNTGKKHPDMLAQHGYSLQPIGFSLDGKRFYAGTHYYSTETGEKLPEKRYLHPGWSAVNSAPVDAESPDGQSIAQTIFYQTVVADANSAEERFKILSGSAAVFTPDSKTLIAAVNLQMGPDGKKSGSQRWAMKYFDAMTGEEQRTFAADEGYVNRLAISPDGKKLAMVVYQETPEQKNQMGIQIWDVATGKRDKTLPMRSEQASNTGRIRFLADGRVLAVEGGNFLGLGSFAWDLSVPMPDDLASKPDYIIGNIEFAFPFTVQSTDGRLAAIWDDRSKELQVRRLGNEKTEIISRRSYANKVSIFLLAFTPDEHLVLAVYHNNTGSLADRFLPRKPPHCEVVNASTGKLLGKVPLSLSNDSPIAGVSPDGRTLVTHEFKLKLRDRFTLWDVPTPTPWLAIFGGTLLPALATYWLSSKRSHSSTSTLPTNS